MGIRCHVPDGSDVAPDESPESSVGEAETLLIRLAERAPAKLRKAHGLSAKASCLAVVEKVAGLKAGSLAPLGKLSTGMYTHEDYLAQFSEDWEREEYGVYAGEVVKKNLAATQPTSTFLEAVKLAQGSLVDRALQKAVLDDHPACIEVLQRLRERVEQAVERGATTVTVEIDDLD